MIINAGPVWPLRVSQETKDELLEALAEIVHTPRPNGEGEAFARGYETGMAFVMLMLGINEAASPERRSLAMPATPSYREIILRQMILEAVAPLLDDDEAIDVALAAATAVMRTGGGERVES